MIDTLNSFLEYFALEDLAALSSDITVGEFMGLVIVAFFALIITVVGVRSIIEFIKILTNFKNFS